MFRNSVVPLRETIIMIMAAFLPLTPLLAQPLIYDLNSGSNTVWKVRPQADIPPETNLSTVNTSGWVNAVVPGTVYASYVEAGLEKDPNYADNIWKADKAKFDQPYWYVTRFKVPQSFTKEKIWLNFNGINRKADIYLNGEKLGSLDGFMERGKFDITRLVQQNGGQTLAVLVDVPKHPMANAASPTYVSSGGWDWMPYIPGLNSGITDKVYLSNTGSLTIENPWIRSKLPTNAQANLTVSLEVKNNSGAQHQANVKGVINPGNISFSQKVTLAANSSTQVKFDKRYFSQLVINSPRLWWPNGYGEPNLYSCELSVQDGDKVSDTRDIKFGIKQYSYDTTGNVLHVSINGTRIFIKGGNWGMSEYMLRCRGSEYDTKVRFHKEMNFNMIRNWIGSTTDEEFYEACDKYGIMVWDDFWLNSNPNLPRDVSNFNANVIEKIRRFRNHPSIAVWCGDNEGWPEAPLNSWIKEDIRTYDGGDRYYQANSHAGNLSGSGPWANKDPRYYFTEFPAGLGGNNGWGLRTELGSAVFTNFESFKKFIPKENWWPRNDMWEKHFFGSWAFNANPDGYDQSIATRYGQPKGIEDYCIKAQLLNIETNKAMYEGWEDHLWDDASGMMTWMSNASNPSLIWQTYDYYYDLTGAYWGIKKACEPVHIQWNPVTNAIKVINTTGRDSEGLTATAAVYNLDGKQVDKYSMSKTIDALTNTAVNCFTMPFNLEKVNLALDKPVVASSTEQGEPSFVNDRKENTRWASKSTDHEWIYVDLGNEEVISGVGLNWEEAYAKSFKVEVSNDTKSWKELYRTTEGKPGRQEILFPEETTARYVRVSCIERGSWWGYSLWDFEVYKGNVKDKALSDVHFIKLQLKDRSGKLVSDNFYWRGNSRKDFTALNTLSKVNLKVSSKVVKERGKCYIHAWISNPATSPSVAFAIRVQAVKSSTGEQILPAVVSDSYFSLLKGEAKDVLIEFDATLLGNDIPRVLAEPYNNWSNK